MDADGHGGSNGARRMFRSSVSRGVLNKSLIQAGLRELSIPRVADEADPPQTVIVTDGTNSLQKPSAEGDSGLCSCF